MCAANGGNTTIGGEPHASATAPHSSISPISCRVNQGAVRAEANLDPCIIGTRIRYRF